MTMNSLSTGEPIQATAVSNCSVPGFLEINMTNGFGMSEDDSGRPVHDANPTGMTMWLGSEAVAASPEVVFDLLRVVPLGELWIWNYNSSTGTECRNGFRRVDIDTSSDGYTWQPFGDAEGFELAMAPGADGATATNLVDGAPVRFDGRPARFVRIKPREIEGNWSGVDDAGNRLFGLSEVRFLVGAGIYPERADAWTSLLRRYRGWTGSDGIFSIPVDGDERYRDDPARRTVFLFSDTFIGTVDPETHARTFVMVNNTLGLLEGNAPDPDRMTFVHRTDRDGRIGNIFDPPGVDHFALEMEHYFWLQDGLCIDDQLMLTALDVHSDPDGPEGLKFRVDGVTMVSCPVSDGVPDYDQAEMTPTGLFAEFPDGSRGFVGCGIFANTQSAGAPDPDGFVYVYGYRNAAGVSDMIVARTTPEGFLNTETWLFFDGEEWSEQLTDATVVAASVSHELSVSPWFGDLHRGKYLLVYQKDISGHLVCARVGETPYGPFGERLDLYHTDEWTAGKGITTYNAKAHPHLSPPGRLLVSYNVNTLSMETHYRDGDVYRPRFIVLEES